jgi:hypothetical protein
MKSKNERPSDVVHAIELALVWHGVPGVQRRMSLDESGYWISLRRYEERHKNISS